MRGSAIGGLLVQQVPQGFGVAASVVHRVVVVSGLAVLLPPICILPVTRKPRCEVAYPSSTEPEWVVYPGTSELRCDPLPIKCRVVRYEHGMPIGVLHDPRRHLVNRSILRPVERLREGRGVKQDDPALSHRLNDRGCD